MSLSFNDLLAQVLLLLSKKKKWLTLYWRKMDLFFYVETRKWITYKKSEKLLQLLILLDLIILEEHPCVRYFYNHSILHKTTIKCTLLRCHHRQLVRMSHPPASAKFAKRCCLSSSPRPGACCIFWHQRVPLFGKHAWPRYPAKSCQQLGSCTLLNI